MLDKSSILYVIDKLISKEKQLEAHTLLDFFESIAKDSNDYNILGECALKSQYHQLRLRCSFYVYTRAQTSEELFLTRENIYACYNSLNMPEDALFYIELNLKLKPNDTDTLISKAANLALLGNRLAAEEIIEAIKSEVTDKKTLDAVNLHLAHKELRNGQTKSGILKCTDTDKPKHLEMESLGIKYWSGGIQPGRKLLIVAEGGIGDELINIRFLDNIKALGMIPILYSSWFMYRPDLVDVFKRHGYDVITNTFFITKDCLWTYMMSLPGYLGLTESQLFKTPYLTPIRNSKNKITDSNFRIGIKCSGNPFFAQDIYRSIPIDDIISRFPTSATIYNFDKEKLQQGTVSLKDKLNTWDDTLDFIDQMDIVVSSCTSIAHLAGAMGKRAIVIVPIAKYYTWVSTRTDNSTPWYGNNFTVLDQTKIRSWEEPLNIMKELVKIEYDDFCN